jgi:hypothetical protein
MTIFSQVGVERTLNRSIPAIMEGYCLASHIQAADFALPKETAKLLLRYARIGEGVKSQY